MPVPGIYAINSTGETNALALEDGSGDKLLLIEALKEQLTPEEQANLKTHLSDGADP